MSWPTIPIYFSPLPVKAHTSLNSLTSVFPGTNQYWAARSKLDKAPYMMKQHGPGLILNSHLTSSLMDQKPDSLHYTVPHSALFLLLQYSCFSELFGHLKLLPTRIRNFKFAGTCRDHYQPVTLHLWDSTVLTMFASVLSMGTIYYMSVYPVREIHVHIKESNILKKIVNALPRRCITWLTKNRQGLKHL